jgi:hypothetical protein
MIEGLKMDFTSPEGVHETPQDDGFDKWWDSVRPFPESTTDGDLARAAWSAAKLSALVLPCSCTVCRPHNALQLAREQDDKY